MTTSCLVNQVSVELVGKNSILKSLGEKVCFVDRCTIQVTAVREIAGGVKAHLCAVFESFDASQLVETLLTAAPLHSKQ
jgi:3-hydroxyisobutyrate dehydrogenase-like beta-hydroxyacid dehydrogenase